MLSFFLTKHDAHPLSQLAALSHTSPQMFCVLLWVFDSYWYYSLFTVFMLVSFECTVVFQRLRSLKELRGLRPKTPDVTVYR